LVVEILRCLNNLKPDFGQAVDNLLDNVFEFYVMFDQYTTAARKIWFKFEQGINSMLAFFGFSQQPRSSSF